MVERTDFLDQHTLLHVCHHVDAVLEGTTIIAGYGVWECSGEVRKVVGQNQGVWELFRCIKSERIYFLALRTLLQYAILWVLCLKRVRQQQQGKRFGSARAK